MLLGAGYDSRAYRFTRLLQDTKVFELDAAPTQERKKACLKKARIEIPKQVTFIPIDFNQDPLMVTLQKSRLARASKNAVSLGGSQLLSRSGRRGWDPGFLQPYSPTGTV